MVNRNLRKLRGFTLLEILVALAIVSIALSAIVNEVSNNINNAAHLRDKTLAHWVAMNKVVELRTAEDWPSPGETHGDALMAEQEWHWSVKVSTTEDEDVRRMDVEVRADEDDENAAATLIAYVERR